MDKQYTVDNAIFDIEDYIGGNVEDVKNIDHMGLTVFLRQTMTKLLQSQADHLAGLPSMVLEDNPDKESEWTNIRAERNKLRQQILREFKGE